MTDEELKSYLNRIITTDYLGVANKREALLKILTPILETLVLCEGSVLAGRVESREAFHLLQVFQRAGLCALMRSHEFVEEDLKQKWDAWDERSKNLAEKLKSTE